MFDGASDRAVREPHLCKSVSKSAEGRGGQDGIEFWVGELAALQLPDGLGGLFGVTLMAGQAMGVDILVEAGDVFDEAHDPCFLPIALEMAPHGFANALLGREP